MSRLSRFLHLERARAGAPEEAEPSAATAERFEGVERPGPAPAAPRSSGADLDRFGPEPPPRIELAEAAPGAQPFTRCMRCGMDHDVFATECAGCGASLDTAAQREFNEKLWARRQEESALEARATAEREAAEQRARTEFAAAQRAMGVEIAREVAERERVRLGGEDGPFGGGGSPGYAGPPLGLRLLQALPDWRWQLGAIAAILAALGGLTALGLRGHPFALLAAILFGLLLVVPRWWLDDS
ncbi:MAG TPA: hypothetical protein VIW03_01030 [Anaeromyxobacter sp.]